MYYFKNSDIYEIILIDGTIFSTIDLNSIVPVTTDIARKYTG